MTEKRADYAVEYAGGVHATWRTYRCWCGREYRSPEADTTRKALYIECDAHTSRPRARCEATAGRDDAATEQIREAAAKAA